jgi:DNA-binding HxlR family transcriptional regulator
MKTRHAAAQTLPSIEPSCWLFGWLPRMAFEQAEHDVVRTILGVLAKRGGRAFESDLAAAVGSFDRDGLTALMRALVEGGFVRRVSGRLVEYGLTDEGRKSLRSVRSS